MNLEYWFKQTADSPLYPELLWSRPENRQHAGKLLIIGGNLHGFAAPAKSFHEALGAGIGVARVIMPDAIKALLGNSPALMMDIEYSPSTPSGSFGLAALADFISQSAWSDGVLLSGDLGQNSETAILLEKYIEKYSGQMTISGDSIEYFTKNSRAIMQRQNTTFILSMPQLQKLVIQLHYPRPITSNLDLLRLVEFLHDFTLEFSVNLIIKHANNIFVAIGGQVSTTALSLDNNDWQVKLAAQTAVWWLQNPSLAFKALTSSFIAGGGKQNYLHNL